MERDVLQYFRNLDAILGDQVVGQMLIPNAAYFDDETTINDTVVLASLDALGGACTEIVVHFLLAPDAAATFLPEFYVNSIDAPATFVLVEDPDLGNIATPAVAGNHRYPFPGILAQGLVLQFRLSQDNAGNANNAVAGALSYKA